ncbi:reverse transcriptase domain-containing protein [Tanacetum coccineum]
MPQRLTKSSIYSRSLGLAACASLELISAIEDTWERRGIANMAFIQLGGSSRVGEMILARERSGFAGKKYGATYKLKEKQEAQQRKFLENLKQLHINILFTEALAQMPKYAKFLKGLLSNKARLDEACTITMNERCFAVLLNKLPSKEKDPGSFTIPCDIGHLHIDNALADLGASISLMPYTMYEKLVGEPKLTRMSLELVDRSIKYPQVIAEDVIIKIDKFVLPIDFVILDMREDSRIPIIFGSPFIATAGAMIDVFNKKITLRVGSEEVIFDVNQSMKKPNTEDDECYGIDDLDTVIQSTAQELLENENLEDDIIRPNSENHGPDSEIPIRRINHINTPYPHETQKHEETLCEHLYSASAIEIDEKKPELKDLPSHLEYAYLKGHKYCPVIILSKLSRKEKTSLLQVLEKQKGEITWKMSDIKGISPSFCTYKILMEESFKPVIQPQRRLNPKVQDVVKDEIVRLLDSGLIYPISDSPWVSHIHVVPKKGGMTVKRRKRIDTISDSFFQISIAPEDQEKTTFTYPYETFSYRRMPFGLCNAPATFQRCMTAIFHDMVEDFMEVFMDDFSVFGNSFDQCLNNLDKMLGRCEETNLVLNWETCHFMVNEGIVLGHKISRKWIEVDKAKIDVIARLPYPKNVKGVRCFLGHAGRGSIRTKNRREIQTYHYASKTLNNAQAHYTTTEKELLAVVFSFDKFRPYLILSKTIVYTDHYAFKIKKGAKNLAADHLSRLENTNIGELVEEEIKDKFLDKHLMILKTKLNDEEPWYADYVNYIVRKVVPTEWTPENKKRFFSQVKNYFWDEPYSFRLCPDNVMRRCVDGCEILKILEHCHSGPTGGHHSALVTGRKVYEAGFYWPNIFRDAKDYVMKCDACLKSGNISSQNEIPQNNIQVCEVFDVWGLDFMGPFPDLRGNKYILVVVDYISKWVEAQALPTNDARVVVKFLKGLFTRFGVPKALISDRGTHFCNSQLEKALLRYGVTHRISTAYHPQTNGQTKVTNRAIKRILERSVGYNPKDWSKKLNEALWAFRTAYKTPTGCTRFRMVYGKACHLPVEIEHKAYWALK